MSYNDRIIENRDIRVKPAHVREEHHMGRRARGFLIGMIIFIIIVVILIIVLIVILIFYRRNTNNGGTTTTCQNDTQCPGGQHCFNNLCSQCSTNSHCSGSTPLCFNGNCVQCNSNNDCASNQVCTNHACVNQGGGGGAVPSTPTNVNITNNGGGSVTISWSPVSGATSYNIYRKANSNDPGPSNFDEKKSTSGANTSFTGLASGTTQYFSVTGVNSNGESAHSNVVSANICGTQPTAPSSPVIVESNNGCSTAQASETVTASSTNTNNSTSTIFVFQGTGQAGNVDSYFYIVQGNTNTPMATNIALKCALNLSTHTVYYALNAQQATVTSSQSGTTTATMNVTWTPLSGVDEYAVMIVSTDSNSNIRHVGSTTTTSSGNLSVSTNAGDTINQVQVWGYSLCNKSSTSASSSHVSPP